MQIFTANLMVLQVEISVVIWSISENIFFFFFRLTFKNIYMDGKIFEKKTYIP